MPRFLARAAAILALALFASCHHQAGGTASSLPPFTALAPAPTGEVFLDQALQVVCSTAIDPESISGSGVQLEAIEGPGRDRPLRGTWRTADRVLGFVPALPQAGIPLPGDAGLQPATTYVLRLAGGTGASVLRDRAGRALAAGATFTFRTVAGAPWFRTASGGPHLSRVAAAPRDEHDRWRLGRLGDFAELRLDFDQPLDPREENLPRRPDAVRTGPIRLEYDDPEYGAGTWIPIEVELERNAQDGATVVVRPRGVLPNAADVRVRVADSLRDLTGEAYAGTAQVATVRTEDAHAPQFDALVARFGSEALANDFFEPEATIADGVLRPPEFATAGAVTGDWQPAGAETFLDTRSQELQLADGRMQRFEGGTFRLRNLRILAGQVVRGLGPNPLVFVVDGDATIAGELTVAGSDAGGPLLAQQYRGPGDVPPPNLGGPGGSAPPALQLIGTQGHCGGGHGGRAGAVLVRAMTGQAGFGPDNVLAGGGGGGLLSCIPGCARGSGGGGGSFATAGDPWFPGAVAGPGTSFQEVRGVGGQGCLGVSGAATRTLAGGTPGPLAFGNASRDDDHWGVAWNPRTRARIRGELQSPRGGAGGGGGGDLANAGGCDPNFPPGNDSRGGDGGAGGGVLILKVRGRLTLAATGRIRADGGDGIGGHQARSSNQTGGGGAGAGGMVVLMAGERIVLHVHGETFANRDYDFAISADGGVCRTGQFSTPVVTGKYPASGTPVFAGATYDGAPLGGFGGLGVIQLMAPVGTDNADGTNTVLDDAIDVVRNGLPLVGAEKQRYLAWRGFSDGSGTNLDDFGNPTFRGGGEGDFRPSPLLMPSPIGTRARARSAWLPLGAAVRRRLQAPDGLPRGVMGEPGPDFGPASSRDGWLPAAVGILEPGSATGVLPVPAAITAIDAAALHAGQPALAISMAAPVLGAVPDRYAGYTAELLDRDGLRATLRIRSHDASTLWFDPPATPLMGLVALQVRAWFVDLQAPLATYRGADGALLPRSNARIGFAFHRAPARALASGNDPDRFPAQVGAFVHDFGDPATAAAVRAFGATHVQWDVLFDQAFARTPADQPPPPDASTRLSLRALWLPYRF